MLTSGRRREDLAEVVSPRRQRVLIDLQIESKPELPNGPENFTPLSGGLGTLQLDHPFATNTQPVGQLRLSPAQRFAATFQDGRNVANGSGFHSEKYSM
ncbi:MAG: hypothetical protein ABI254_09265 [Chthoniobacterales bacterium]